MSYLPVMPLLITFAVCISAKSPCLPWTPLAEGGTPRGGVRRAVASSGQPGGVAGTGPVGPTLMVTVGPARGEEREGRGDHALVKASGTPASRQPSGGRMLLRRHLSITTRRSEDKKVTRQQGTCGFVVPGAREIAC